MRLWFFVIVYFNDNTGSARLAIPLSQGDYEV